MNLMWLDVFLTSQYTQCQKHLCNSTTCVLSTIIVEEISHKNINNHRHRSLRQQIFLFLAGFGQICTWGRGTIKSYNTAFIIYLSLKPYTVK